MAHFESHVTYSGLDVYALSDKMTTSLCDKNTAATPLPLDMKYKKKKPLLSSCKKLVESSTTVSGKSTAYKELPIPLPNHTV